MTLEMLAPASKVAMNLLQVVAYGAAAATGRVVPTTSAPRLKPLRHPFAWLALTQLLPWTFEPILPPAIMHGPTRPLAMHVVIVLGSMLSFFAVARLVHLLDTLESGPSAPRLLVGLYGAAAVASVLELAPHPRDLANFLQLIITTTLWAVALRKLIGLRAEWRPTWGTRCVFGAGIVSHCLGWLTIGITGRFDAAYLVVGMEGAALSVPFVWPRMRRPLMAGLLVTAAAALAWVTTVAVTSLPALAASEDPSMGRVLSAANYLVFALIWTGCARAIWRNGRGYAEPGTAWTLLLLLSIGFATSSALTSLLWLVPSRLMGMRAMGPVFMIREWLGLASIAMACHTVAALTSPGRVPRRVLVAIYGAAGAMALLALGFESLGATEGERIARFLVVQLVFDLGAAMYVIRGLIRAGGHTAQIRFRSAILGGSPGPVDVALFALAIVGIFSALFSGRFGANRDDPSVATNVLLLLAGLAAAAPVALRALGEVLRTFIAAGTAIAAALVLALLLHDVVPTIESAGLPRLATSVVVIGLAGVLVPGQWWLRHRIEGLVFRGALARRARVRRALAELSPDAGLAACCDEAVRRFVAALGARAAGIRLTTGESFGTPGFHIQRLARAWPGDPAGPLVPGRMLSGSFELRMLPPQFLSVLIEEAVTTIVPIRSPRRDWGHLVVAMRLLDSTFQDEDLVTVATFARELALLLDASDLVARVRGAERSLAHAEKLAAVGEAAARIAHDVRNPITAVRSLAQQLKSEPDDPFRDEHALMLAELERVERHVAALLRFSRRDEPRLARVDLADVVRTAVAPLARRLGEDDVAVTLDVPEGIVVTGDADALRNVVTNLVENARDALRTVPPPRRLSIALDAPDGTARLRVRDSGPGVPPDAIGRLFEPFFSLKPSGTGLGLAIAKRAVDAHGGSIHASHPPDGGIEVAIVLPRSVPA